MTLEYLDQPAWEKMCKMFWNWFYPIPRTGHPALDNTGKLASIGQNNPDLFFLTGPVDRTDNEQTPIIQAKGKRIFVPILFCSFVESEVPKGTDLVEAANKDIDATRSIRCNTSDGIIIQDVRRVRVPELFEVEVADPPFFKNTTPGKQMASSDGYWLLTKPLDAGHHTISTSGETKEDNEFYGGIKYHLEVT
ncbi:MAG: hypothetical protein M3227_03770 [Thermoproteota archaeon]|nr:hypothetical protein [Thermoproteota archaeon]